MRLRRIATLLAAPWRALAAAVDPEDLHVYGGLVLVGIGCWLAYPPSAGIVPGAVIVWLGLGAPGIHRPKERR